MPNEREAKPNDRAAAGDRSDPGYRALPAVSTVLTDERLADGGAVRGPALARAVQDALDRERRAIEAGARPTRADVTERVVQAVLALNRPRLLPVLNATGVVVHTNLGRAPVSRETAAAMAAAAANAVPLEIEPATNERGGRLREIAELVRLLTGAEAALVVNNGAAAVLLALSAVAAGRSVVVSRGEAIEIGGGFRIPDVMAQSGARLVEVGTTNRTYVRDFEAATDGETAAYLKVHPSNFRLVGFAASPTTGELVESAAGRGIPVLEDVGSGALLDTAAFGLGHEPTIQESLAAGAALVMASGDKLLGGPQAGIIAGRAAFVERLARHPLARALRADKTCLAGLAATLRHYARDEAVERIPIWRMIAAAPASLRARAEAMVARVRAEGVIASVEPSQATVGGGALPGQTLPSFAVAVAPGDGDGADALAGRLRVGDPAVFGRIERDRLLVDLRTVLPEDDARLEQALRAALRR